MIDALQITLRLVHLLGGVFWAGSVFLLARFMLPAVRAAGPAGDQVVEKLFVAQKLGVAIPIAAVLTVLSGATMYTRNIIGSSGVWAQSRPAIVYGVGGACALIALLLGMAVIAPSFQRIIQIATTAQASGKPLSIEDAETIARMKERGGLGTRLAAILLLITVMAMAVGRYV